MAALLLLSTVLTNPALTKRPEHLVPNFERVNGKDAVAGEVLVKFSTINLKTMQSIKELVDAETDRLVGGTGTHLIKSRTKTAASLVRELSARKDVIYAEPNYIVHTDLAPNDPELRQMWGLQNTGQIVEGYRGIPGADVDVIPAWAISSGSRTNVVGIVDTGIDYTHPDLAANVWSAPAAFTVQVGGQSISCQAGSHGFNALSMTCDPRDDNRHGTHVSGTIGAVGNNNNGVVGINQTASLMGLKFLNELGYGSLADALNALEFAVQVKASFGNTGGANIRVLNNSWGGDPFSQALLDQINRTRDAEMLFVAAAGNDGRGLDSFPIFPASYSNYTDSVVTVAATNNVDGLASFIDSASNYGRQTVHLGAPGIDVLSTIPQGKYTFFSGSSMATPHVSGAAALILSRCSLSTAALKETILQNVEQVPALKDITITGGRLNVNRAITSCGPPDYYISANPAYRVLTAGAQTEYEIKVQPVNGFSETVTLSVAGLPNGVAANFNNPTATNGSSILTISTTASVAFGRHQLTVVGTSSSGQRIGVLQLDLPEYSVRDLGALLGHTDSRANSLNNAGQVVGYSYLNYGNNHPFLFSNGSMVDLTLNGTQGIATDINSLGHVVGRLSNTTFSGFFYRDGQLTALPAQLNGDIQALNDADQVTGYLSVNGDRRAFLYTPGLAVTDFGPGTEGFGLNNSGQVVGYAVPNGGERAALFANNTVSYLGLPADIGGRAIAINNSGQITGWISEDIIQGFLSSNGSWNRIGAFGGSSFPEAINASGSIVGNTAQGAFLFRNNSIENLNDLMPVDAYCDAVDAHDINDQQQIAGTCYVAGHVRAFLASPWNQAASLPDNPPTVILASPANYTSLIDPGKVALTAIVNSASISKVDFYVGDTLVGTSTAAPYTTEWRDVLPGTWHFSAVATTLAGQAVASLPNVVTIFGSEMQFPYSHSDVGAVGFRGHGTSVNGTYTVNGSGTVIGGTDDSCHFVYRTINGERDVNARNISQWSGDVLRLRLRR
jgi:probable HAF family extracellular repeat protein